MNHVLSTHLFANHRLSTVLFDKIWDARIPSVEIFCARQHLDWHDPAQIRELGFWFRDSELKLHAVHAPMYTDEYWGRSGPHSVINITEPEKRKRLAMVDEIKRAIAIAETVPFRYLIQHIGVNGEEYSDRGVEAAFGALEEVIVFARQRGVEVLVENMANGFSTAERLLLFNELTHLHLNFCFDVGHAHINEGIESAYGLMKSRIRSTHVHDNNGTEDQHLFPLVAEHGTIDWEKAMSLLGSRPDEYPLVLELTEVAGMASPIGVARDVFDKLEALPGDRK